jgi:hypothetical protein
MVNSRATIIGQQTDWVHPQEQEATVISEGTSSPFWEQKPAATPRASAESSRRGDLWGAIDNDHSDIAEAVAVAQDGAPEFAGVATEEHARAEANTEHGAHVAFAEEVGEVLGISQEFHPAEVPDDEAEAELVGEDYNCTVAIPQNSQSESFATPQGDPTGQGPSEVQAAMFVGYDDHDENGPPIQLATARAYSYGSPSSPEPVTQAIRAFSAPSRYRQEYSANVSALAARSEVANEVDASADDDWMRTPPFGGTSSDQVVEVIQLPTREETAHVAVSILPAPASSPPIDDGPMRCSVDDPPARGSMSPAARAATLDAFASAQNHPSLDETDCHAVAMMRQRSSMGAASVTSSITEHADVPLPGSFHSTGGESEGGECVFSASYPNERGTLQTKVRALRCLGTDWTPRSVLLF